MKRAPLNLILLGDPASGKATQAARIVKRYHLYDFDMGRELMKPVVRARFDYRGTKAKGALTPTNVVRGILRRVILDIPRERGILFDGHPKMIGEAMLVARLLRHEKRADPLVIYLSITAAEILRRAGKRGREDDSRQALKRRERYYRDQMQQVIGFFQKRYVFKKLSGMGTRAEIWKKMAKTIQQYVSQNA